MYLFSHVILVSNKGFLAYTNIGGDFMNFCPQKLLNCLLCSSNIKLPINKNHYVTGQDISLFSKLVCIEQELSNITCNIQGYCKCIKNSYFK